jgi:hypothetical protein
MEEYELPEKARNTSKFPDVFTHEDVLRYIDKNKLKPIERDVRDREVNSIDNCEKI